MSSERQDQPERGWRESLTIYRRMLAYVRPYWPYLVAAAFFLVLVSLLGLVMPWVVQNLVDLVTGGPDFSRLNSIALILVVVFVLRAFFGFLYSYLVAWVGERVVAKLRLTLYEHLLALSLGFFSEQRAGEIVSRLGSDVQMIQTAVTSNLIVLLQQIVTAVGVLVIMAMMNWRLTMLLAVAVPGMVLLTRLLGREMRRISRAVQDVLADASALVQETVGGIRIIKSFAREEYETGRYGQVVDTLFRAAMRRVRVSATLGPLISLLSSLSLILVLWVGGREVMYGRLTPGQLIAFVLYALMLAGPFGSFASLYGQFQVALGATDRVFALLDARPEIVELPGAKPLSPVVGHVVFEDVSFDYDPRQPVLHLVNLEARPGQVVALVGPSGVGKSTLVNLIPRFYDVTGGRILIDGHDIRSVTVHSLRDQIGIVPQETMLFSDTIAANIRYGKLDASREEVEAAAKAANAHDFIIRDLADGYDSQVGERGVKLSGGQRQRIAIARAILKNPRILILDEATSSLDTESEQLVQEALEHLMHPAAGEGEGRTTFVIAHRLSTITNADQIVVLRDGRVAEQGTHQDLLARKDSLYHHYHALQFRWDEDRAQGVPEVLVRSAAAEEEWTGYPLSFLTGGTADLGR